MSRRLWVCERGVMWMMDLQTSASPSWAYADAIVTFHEVSVESATALALAMGIAEREIVRRFDSGSRCFVSQAANDGILAYGWISQGAEEIGELERTLHMPPREAYIWDCATLPFFRRRGLYSGLLRYIVATLHAEGFRRLWIGTSLSNIASLRGFASAGFQPVVRITYVRVLAFRHSWLRAEAGAPPALVASACAALANTAGRRRRYVEVR